MSLWAVKQQTSEQNDLIFLQTAGRNVCHVNLLRPYHVCALSLGSSGSVDSPSSATAPPLTAWTAAQSQSHICVGQEHQVDLCCTVS